MLFDQKTAIVTGASRGIGAAIAKRLAAEGASVAVNYSRDEAGASAVVQEITAEGGTALAIQADVSEPEAFKRLFDTTEGVFGAADILINNAGTMRLSPLAEATDADFDRQLSVNLGGTFRSVREAAKRLNNGGRIINITSSVVGLYQPGYGLYAATKAAVEALTHVLAKELGPRAITVNAISPGPIATDFFMTGKPQELVDTISRSIPLGRLGEPDDIAKVVSLICGPDSGWVNGQIIRANGGVI